RRTAGHVHASGGAPRNAARRLLLGVTAMAPKLTALRLSDRVSALARAARRWRGLLAGLGLVVLFGPPVAFGVWTWRTVSTVDLSRLEDAALIYAAGQVLAPGMSIEAADLPGALRRLGYRETQSPPAAPGQYRRETSLWEIYLRARDDPGAVRPALPV